MEYPTTDLYLAAYLRSKGEEPELRLKGSVVVFVFDFEAVNKRTEEYWNGAQVDTLEFSEKIKETRTLMYNKKNENKA